MQRNVPSGSLLSAQLSESRRADGTISRTTATKAPSTTPKPNDKQCAGQTEPRGQQSHQFGVAQSNALAAANQPVDPADEQDEASGGDDAEQPNASNLDIFPVRAMVT